VTHDVKLQASCIAEEVSEVEPFRREFGVGALLSLPEI
jgi:hypothetical protein